MLSAGGSGRVPAARAYGNGAAGVAPAGALPPPPVAAALGRVPPHDTEAEMSVLGALLLGNPDALARALEALRSSDFYRTAHGRVFEAMAALAGRGEPVDIVTLKDELVRAGGLDEAGGLGYLMALGDFVPTTANVEYYAAIVRKKALLRDLIGAASQIAGMAYGEGAFVTAATEAADGDAGDDGDADRIADRAEELLFAVCEQQGRRRAGSGGQTGWVPVPVWAREVLDETEARYHAGGGLSGLSTGLSQLDDITSGLQEADFWVVGARASMGKTAIALSIARAVARAGGVVGFFSEEMAVKQLGRRVLSAEARVDGWKLQRGYLTDPEWTRLEEATRRVWDLPLHIEGTPNLSAAEMRARTRRLAAKAGGVDLVIVDYIQISRAERSGRRGADSARRLEIEEVARGLKSLAKEFRVPVIGLSQINRGVERREDKRPTLSDLAEGGSIEAEADVALLLYRPSYYARKEEPDAAAGNPAPPPADPVDPVEVIVAKQRNGPVGTVKAGFLPAFTAFVNLDEDHENGGNPF